MTLENVARDRPLCHSSDQCNFFYPFTANVILHFTVATRRQLTFNRQLGTLTFRLKLFIVAVMWDLNFESFLKALSKVHLKNFIELPFEQVSEVKLPTRRSFVPLQPFPFVAL